MQTETPGQDILPGCRTEGVDDLPNRFCWIVAYDKQMVFSAGPGRKACIPCQDDAVLFKGEADDLVVVVRGVVQDIVAKEAEALGEFPEHGIGNELHLNPLPATKARRGWDH